MEPVDMAQYCWEVYDVQGVVSKIRKTGICTSAVIPANRDKSLQFSAVGPRKVLRAQDRTHEMDPMAMADLPALTRDRGSVQVK